MLDLKIRKIRSSLLYWFQKNKRPLPWRRDKNPYKIWISEIMLQQTQVKTVIPYYKRWLRKFPTLAVLARAPLPKVLKAWEGLGYYTRARNIHETSKIILRKLEGRFPASCEELEKLPGIGRCTAGAIASIAFNQPEPILDGNVKRVLARLLALKEPVDTSQGEKKLWKIAEVLVVGAGLVPALRQGGRAPTRGAPTGNVSNCLFGDFNQALMELGALVCSPENPQCLACPVRNFCKAHQLKRETGFPVQSRRQRLEKLRTVAAVIWKNGRVLIERRPLHSRWGGLWVFPQWVCENGKREGDFLKEKVRSELKTEVGGLKPRMDIHHGFTKYRVRLRVYEGKALSVIARTPSGRRGNLRSKIAPPPIYALKAHGPYRPKIGGGIASPAFGGLAMTRWMSPSQLSHLPLPSPHKKIAALIQDHA